MSGLADRNKQKGGKGTANQLAGKSKYAVNIVFDGVMEQTIRQRAKEKGLPIATYIKALVYEDINR